MSKTHIPKCARSRIKENIKVARKSGKHSVAKDLGIHVYLADTLHYYEGQEKSSKKIEA
jgi:hypothetical protein